MEPKFHGFYYTNKENGVCGLGLTKSQGRTMEAVWGGSFDLLPHEIYWRRLARYMVTHAPQGYIAWNGVPHWIVGNCGRIVGTGGYENGVNILQFREDRTFAYQWYSLPESTNKSTYDPVYDLVFTPWDWLLEGDGDDKMFRLSDALAKELSRLMAWTDEIHAELEKRWPSEKHWE
jgi:hypothetical protein